MNFRLTNRWTITCSSRSIPSPGWASTWSRRAKSSRALEEPHQWILQKKVQYAEFVPTVGWSQIKGGNPDDVCLAGWTSEPILVNNLVRMSQGKMMGVDFNKDKTWVGSSIALHERGN